jgi:hypothetical protein
MALDHFDRSSDTIQIQEKPTSSFLKRGASGSKLGWRIFMAAMKSPIKEDCSESSLGAVIMVHALI